MKKLMAIAVIVTTCLIASSAQKAEAQGVHFGGRGLHVDMGRPHGDYYGRRSTFCGGPSFRGYFGGGWGGGYRGYSDWHDTSHFDYQPGGYRSHFNHYDYSPPHYDYHSQGHRDYHH